MNPDIDLLHRIRIASPCSASWEEMRGDERVRFCQQCRLNVYNLSAMEPENAEKLVREKEGRLCVRYYARPDGTMPVRDCPVGFQAARRTVLARIAAGAAAFAGLVSLKTFRGERSQPAVRHERLIQIDSAKRLNRWVDPDLWRQPRRESRAPEAVHPVMGHILP